MGLENVTFVAQLVTTNPDGATDTIDQGDDHLRLIKRSLVNSFPHITSTLQASAAELNNLDGYLGNTNDLNVLQGAASAGIGTTHIAYLAGLTSTIQAQIDAIPTATWELIQTITPTAASEIDITFDETTYSNIMIELEDIIPATDNVTFYIRFGHTNGGTIVTSANYIYRNHVYSSATITTASLQTEITTVTNVGTDANEGITGKIETIGFNSTTSPPGIMADLSWTLSTGTYGINETRGYMNTGVATVYDTVRLFWSSGNFEANGEIRVHGLRK